MKSIKSLAAVLLIFGIVDQIHENVALVEYTKYGQTYHSKVSLDHSACIPTEGQKVYFYKDYKIVTCEEM